MANLKWKDNDSLVVSPKYGNITRNLSKEGDGYYYTLDCEEGRINANEHLAQAITDHWCGREGKMQITRLNATRWEVKNVQQGNNYPLDMREWNGERFVDIPFEIVSEGSEPLVSHLSPESPAEQTVQKNGTPTVQDALDTFQGELMETPQTIQPEKKNIVEFPPEPEPWEQMRKLLSSALLTTQESLNDAGLREEFGATEVQKMAVTLYMDAMRRNLAPRLEFETDDLPI